MLCLNRGEDDTGPAWYTKEIAAVAYAVRLAQGADDPNECREAAEGQERGDNDQEGGEKPAVENGAEDGRPESKKLDKLPIDVWWGGQDGMVPRNGQGELLLTPGVDDRMVQQDLRGPSARDRVRDAFRRRWRSL